MYFALIMLKCISPSDPVDLSIPITLAAKPAQLAPSAPAEPRVTTKLPEVELEPHVATLPRPSPHPERRAKRNKLSCFYILVSIFWLMVFIFGQYLIFCLVC